MSAREQERLLKRLAKEENRRREEKARKDRERVKNEFRDRNKR